MGSFFTCSTWRLVIHKNSDICQSVYSIPQVLLKSVIIWMTTKVMILTLLVHLRKTSHPVKHHFELSALLDHPTGLSAYIGLARRTKSIRKQGELPKPSFTPQQCSTHCHVEVILTWFQKCHRHQQGQHANAARLVAVMNLTKRSLKKQRQDLLKEKIWLKYLMTLGPKKLIYGISHNSQKCLILYEISHIFFIWRVAMPGSVKFTSNAAYPE